MESISNCGQHKRNIIPNYKELSDVFLKSKQSSLSSVILVIFNNKTVCDKNIETVPVPLVDTYSKRDGDTNK